MKTSKEVSRKRNSMKRVAFNITEALDKNIEVYALKNGCLKSEVFIQALRAFLKTQKMDPDREPVVSFSYSPLST